ncbi:MAG: lipoyl(octanoyl) transferase LipB [Ignavibacteriales bacterium]|nr:lipoyl(octanoyl) transferase LipB [Ignavibacteriales bacterium]
MQLAVSNIGRTKYADAWELQHKLFDLRHYGLIGDMLLFTEHEHVYTIGKGGDENHLLASEAELSVGGIDVAKIDRGGDITYHGPGQVVGYPIIDLNNYYLDIHRYLRSLEEVIILTLDEFDIEAGREEGLTGVWVQGEKIAAFGVKVSRWITMHGFALNVNTDLQKFERIIPCGIFHKGVTSMQKILGKEIALEDVHRKLTESFSYVFGCQPLAVSPDMLRQRVATLQVNLGKQEAEQNLIVKS